MKSKWKRLCERAQAGDQSAIASLEKKKLSGKAWRERNPDNIKSNNKRHGKKVSALIADCNNGNLSGLDKLMQHREKRRVIMQKNRAKKRGDAELRTAQKNQCKRGHLLSEGNVYISRTGSRECRACSKARNLAKYRGNEPLYPPAPAAPVTV